MANVIPIAFSIFVVMVIFNVCCDIMMRVRLTQREPRSEKLLWWRRGGDEVASTYQELFPRSFLARLRVFTFWLFLIFAVTLLALMVWQKS